MSELNRHIASIKQDLNQVLFGLNGLNDYNFDERMNLVQNILVDIQKKKNFLTNHFSDEELKNFNPELDSITKQITLKFDSMIKERNHSKNKIGIEIQNNENRKKLVKYKR